MEKQLLSHTPAVHACVVHRTDKHETVSDTVFNALGHGGTAAALAPDALLATVRETRAQATPRISKSFAPPLLVVVHPHACVTVDDDVMIRNIHWRRT